MTDGWIMKESNSQVLDSNYRAAVSIHPCLRGPIDESRLDRFFHSPIILDHE